MTERDLLDATARVLRGADPPLTRPTDNARMRAIIAMENARDHSRRRRLRIMVGGVAAAAAVLLAIGVGPQLRARPHQPQGHAARGETLSGTAVLIRDATEVSLGVGTAIRSGDRVLTADGIAAITLPTGTRVTVERATDLAVLTSAGTQTFYLAAGGIHARVAKLVGEERFIVRTTDAEIEVRGTAFRVTRVPGDVRCFGGSTTRVLVEEGIVTVRAGGVESRVGAGEAWPAGCLVGPAPASSTVAVLPSNSTAPAVTGTSSPKHVAPITPLPAASIPAAAPSASSAPSAPPSSDLAEQNDLFGAAMAAKHAGDKSGAVIKLERLLAKYPGAALAEQATVERFKLLASYNRTRAVEAAEAYLARYPTGFARTEARALVEHP